MRRAKSDCPFGSEKWPSLRNRPTQRALRPHNERNRGIMDEREHIDTTSARAGATPHMTRYILPISLGLVIILFALLLFLWK